MLDYLVVGLGLSGLAISENLRKKDKSFMVFEDGSQKSSLVAGGVFNPVILKRFTLAWQADEQLKKALPFYEALEKLLGINCIQYWNILRRFSSIAEQNNWFTAADKPKLGEFLDTSLVKEWNSQIPSKYAFGRVLKTGNIDTRNLLHSYRNFLQQQGKIKFEKFDYSALKILKNELEYKGVQAKKIIFCEGFGLTKNPYFNYLPMRGNKGEYLHVKAEHLQLKQALKSSIFLLPLGNNYYKVGATYNHKDKTAQPSAEARVELVKKLKDLIHCDFEVVAQEAGIRPATKDRRPLAGVHPEQQNLFCCNGFGSRGVLIAPTLAEQLVNFIEDGKPLPVEVNLERFTKKHF